MSKIEVIILCLCFAFGGAQAQLSKAQRNYIDLIVTPNHADWNYTVGQDPQITVTAYKSGIVQNGASVRFAAGEELFALDMKGKGEIKEGSYTFTLPTRHTPGFIQCRIELEVDGKTYIDQVKLAFDPHKIEPTIPMPVDFERFWSMQLESVAGVALEFTRIFSSEYSTEKVDVYEVSFRVNKAGNRMYGWLTIPKKEGRFPAVLIPPGAGIKKQIPSLQYAENGVISLQIEIHGLPFSLSDEQYSAIRSAIGDYWSMNLDHRENYYFNHVYLGCKRSIDLIYDLPEFNGFVATTGGSQGGALALITAALDKRVRGVAAFYPALCDLTGYLHNRAGGWPHLFNAKNLPMNNTPQKVENIAYYDVVNFARIVSVPIFYSFGYNDNTCPPTSLYAAYNVISSPKILVVEPISAHWRYPDTNQESIEWIKKLLK